MVCKILDAGDALFINTIIRKEKVILEPVLPNEKIFIPCLSKDMSASIALPYIYTINLYIVLYNLQIYQFVKNDKLFKT